MIACLDVHYQESLATIGVVAFSEWNATKSAEELVTTTNQVSDYVPGEFYRRELPCLTKAIGELSINPDIIVIDGFVWLDGEGQKGLGAYLHEANDKRIPVIGVAKNSYRDSSHAELVYRGESDKALLVTSVGIEVKTAAQCIQRMAGAFRIPKMIKRADQLSRVKMSK